ncbi:MAG: hypothetical protein WD734_03440 [Dehalococcoidia bacterium]
MARPLPDKWGVARRRLSRLMLVSIALLLVAAVGLFQVLQTSRVAAIGYDVRALELERQALDADIRLLEGQIASSSNLEALRNEATTRLGMVAPEARVRVGVDTPAPAVVPLPRRYVPLYEPATPPDVSWWEDFFDRVPGLH